MTRMVWGISKWRDWQRCEAMFVAKYVDKQWKDFPSPQMERGREIHKAFEDGIKYDILLTDHADKAVHQFEPLRAWLYDQKAEGANVVAEHKLGITRNFQPTDFFGKDLWARLALDVVVEAPDSVLVIDWKGLALDTLLPTPTGWTTMAEVRPGDELFGGDGRTCQVKAKSQVKNIRCFRLRFDDTSEVVCDEEHLWPVEGVGVVDAATMATMRALGLQLRVAVAKPLDLPASTLPIDPYLLGLWLGDGTRCRGTITKPDTEVWQEVESRGFRCGVDQSYSRQVGQRTVFGLQTSLRAQGLLNNKHVPDRYLRSSYPQRLDLLRGLMDSDGSVNPTRKQCVFTTTDKRLSDGVLELLLSLGQRPLQSVTTQHGFGLTVTAYPVSFRPLRGLQPFLLSRKADKVGEWGHGNSGTRRVIDIVEVPSVPTQCIAVDSPDNTYLCTAKMLVTHNTGRYKPEHREDAAFYQACVRHALQKPTTVQYHFIDEPANSFALPEVTTSTGALAGWMKRTDTADAALAAGKADLMPGPQCRWCGSYMCPKNTNPKLSGGT